MSPASVNTSPVSRFTCRSGAVFVWTQETTAAAGVMRGYFEGQRPSMADVEEVQVYLRSQIPENSETVFEKVIVGPPEVTRQQVIALSDRLLQRPGRN